MYTPDRLPNDLDRLDDRPARDSHRGEAEAQADAAHDQQADRDPVSRPVTDGEHADRKQRATQQGRRGSQPPGDEHPVADTRADGPLWRAAGERRGRHAAREALGEQVGQRAAREAAESDPDRRLERDRGRLERVDANEQQPG